MRTNLKILFTNPCPMPADGFLVSYRPLGTTAAYFTHTSLTGSPIHITANLLENTDYEGNIKSICGTEFSTIETFATSNY